MCILSKNTVYVFFNPLTALDVYIRFAVMKLFWERRIYQQFFLKKSESFSVENHHQCYRCYMFCNIYSSDDGYIRSVNSTIYLP